VSVVNALSEKLELEIWREGYTWQQEYSCGAPKAPLAKAGKAGRKTGTRVTFKPDVTIMEATEFNYDTLAQRLRELAFLNKGLKITLADERVDPEKKTEFLYTGGISEFIRHLNRGKTVLHDKPIHFEADRELPNNGTLTMEVALPVQRWILGERFQLREQYQHRGWGNAPERIPLRAHPHHQRVRPAGWAVQRCERKTSPATTCAKA